MDDRRHKDESRTDQAIELDDRDDLPDIPEIPKVDPEPGLTAPLDDLREDERPPEQGGTQGPGGEATN